MAKKNKDTIQEENRRLRRENAYLRHRLSLLGEKLPTGETVFETRFSEVLRTSSLSHVRTYFGYLIGKCQKSALFRLWDRTRFAVRGFFLATKIWNFLIFLFALLGFGTQFLLFVSATAILLPALAVISLVVGSIGFFAHRRQDRELAAYLASCPERKQYLIFAPANWEKHAYFCHMLSEFGRDGVVFLVFTSFAACGYRSAKPLSEHVYAVHISYYFSLKKHLMGDIIQIF